MAYGSAPVLAAHAGVSLPAASAVLIAVAVAGMELVRRSRPPAAGAVAALAATGGIAAGYWLTGPGALAGVVVTGLSAAVLLARALTPSPAAVPAGGVPPGRGAGGVPPGPPDAPSDAPSSPAGRLAAAGLGAGLGYVLPVLVYQVHYDLELPFDNRFALVAAAGMLSLAGARRRPAPAPRRGAPDLPAGPAGPGRFVRPAAVSGAATLALLVPLGAAVTGPAVPGPEQTGATVRLMSWNVMYGRHHTGGVPDPESIAAAIEAADPDLVLLQEVSRGWPIGGGVDLLEWLSRRLGMRYEWAPAADGQFGNAVLTRLRYSGVRAARLPFVQGPMQRSYLTATLHLDGGRELRVINAHLQHRKENTPTRLVQIQALLDEWDGAAGTVVAGDFNFWPSWPERRLWEGAGLVSAQDLTGNGAEFTVPSDDPDNRVDWIFGTPDLAFSDFAILDGVISSDHFPLVVTVELD
jgi:endonuclease/exonuclease/phosphatase family metal-dependent hydrolase